ncbi:MAG: putative oxidoreductase [Ilumatobacter sp.]|jgi:putative oxidoreductase
MLMDFLWLVGRILFGLTFVGSGIGHFAQTDRSAKRAASKGLPQPKNMVLLSGVTFFLGGLSIILGVFADFGALLVIATLIPATFLLHKFWEETDPMIKHVEISLFLKNLSLIGGCIILFSFFARDGSGGMPYTLTDGLFNF